MGSRGDTQSHSKGLEGRQAGVPSRGAAGIGLSALTWGPALRQRVTGGGSAGPPKVHPSEGPVVTSTREYRTRFEEIRQCHGLVTHTKEDALPPNLPRHGSGGRGNC